MDLIQEYRNKKWGTNSKSAPIKNGFSIWH